MLIWLSTAIPVLFYLLFFFVPLVLFPKSSELFEFNKMVLVYGLTTLIVAFWVIKMIVEKRITFRRTTLDIPLLLFLGSQILSTLTSIDPRTSIFGYYSRFHGGLLSSISYSLLYWGYVSNMDKEKTKKAIYFLLSSAVLVSLYGVAEHFGIDKDIWVQDVQNRVFSTLGQPNWLAAWLVALIPLTWAFALNSKFKIQSSKLQLIIQKYWLWIGLSALFFLVLLYTGSRSGLLGFAVANIIFWLAIAAKTISRKKKVKEHVKTFIFIQLTFLVITAFNGTQLTPSIFELLEKGSSPTTNDQSPIAGLPRGDEVALRGPALEIGGSKSVEIRKIVWQGATDIWRNYPILGTGVETFAFSYYNFRPVEHNLVSEWDFLYNKAHNEYLNFLATSGVLGLGSNLLIVVVFATWVRLILANKESKLMRILSLASISSKFASHPHEQGNKTMETKILITALFAGYISILVTNFFGFSVVPVALQFFLYPGIAVALATSDKRQVTSDKEISISNPQKLATVIVLLITFYLLLITGRYWYADFLYAKGKLENDSGNHVRAHEILNKATKLSSRESIFWEELADTSSEIALSLNEEGDVELGEAFANQAILESERAIILSPRNVNILRKRASLFVKLASFNLNYLINARDTLLSAIELAPTDAKLSYNLALTYVRAGDNNSAIEVLEKTIKMKPNYRNARLALALLLIDEGDMQRAKQELEYILEKIDPNDVVTKKELDELESGQ